MKIIATQLRNNTTIIRNNEPWKVVSFEHRTPGKGNALISAKLKNILNGATAEQRYRPGEQIERAELQEESMTYIYEEGDSFVFMNSENYEQISIEKELLGNDKYFLKDDMSVQVQLFNNKPIGVKLPKLVQVRIKDTEPHLKGATAARQTKPATIESGLTIQVPPFIEPGDLINVDTETLKYSSRASE